VAKTKGEAPTETSSPKQKPADVAATATDAAQDSTSQPATGHQANAKQARIEPAKVEIASANTDVPAALKAAEKQPLEKSGDAAGPESTKAEDKKIAKIEAADKATSKPTTAPTFHAVAPHTDSKK